MNFKVLLQILRTRWILFLAVSSAVLGLVGLGTWLQPRTYTATASLVVDAKVDPIAGTALVATMSPSYLMTQVDILQSARVAAKVVQALRLTEIAQLREQWLSSTKGIGEFESWLVDLMRSNLEVRPSRGSNLINLYYSGTDPKFAAAVANAFVQAYMDTILELRTSPAKDYSRFFDANAKEQRDKLETAQARLSEFQRKNGLIANDERLDIETQRLSELSAQVVTMQAAVADSQSRQTQAQSQGDRMSDVNASPVVTALRTDLARQEGQLEQITARLGDNHPSVRELRSGIADARNKLEAEIKRAQSGVGINNQVNQSRLAQARASLEEQRARVLKLRAVRDEAALLQREVENAQRSYDGVLGRLSMTSLESQVNQASVALLEKAQATNRPSSPRVLLNLLLGGVVSLIAGLVAVMLRESRDRRVRAPSDLTAIPNLPVVGVMPSFGGRRKLLRRPAKSSLIRLGLSGRKAA